LGIPISHHHHGSPGGGDKFFIIREGNFEVVLGGSFSARELSHENLKKSEGRITGNQVLRCFMAAMGRTPFLVNSSFCFVKTTKITKIPNNMAT
jgi:hypothetical protein